MFRLWRCFLRYRGPQLPLGKTCAKHVLAKRLQDPLLYQCICLWFLWFCQAEGSVFLAVPSSIGSLVTTYLPTYPPTYYTLLKNTIREHSERLVTLETCYQSDEETLPDLKLFRFSETFQIFENCSNFRKLFRFLETFQISENFSDFQKLFRFSETFQIFGNFSDFLKIF